MKWIVFYCVFFHFLHAEECTFTQEWLKQVEQAPSKHETLQLLKEHSCLAANLDLPLLEEIAKRIFVDQVHSAEAIINEYIEFIKYGPSN